MGCLLHAGASRAQEHPIPFSLGYETPSLSVHIYAPQWELPAIVVSLVLGLSMFVVPLQRRRFPAVRDWIGFACIIFSMVLAIVHGWAAAVIVVYAVAVLAFNVASQVVQRRLWRALFPTTAETGGDSNLGIHLPYDGRVITLHPDRGKLLAQAIVQVSFVGILESIGLLIIATSQDERGAMICVVAGIFVVFPILTICRVLQRRPMVIVDHEGIVDNMTLIATGLGRIQWGEIEELVVLGQKRAGGFLSGRYVAVITSDPKAILVRQPLWKRALSLVVGGRWMPFPVKIWEFALPIPAEEIVAQVKDYVEAHWRDPP